MQTTFVQRFGGKIAGQGLLDLLFWIEMTT